MGKFLLDATQSFILLLSFLISVSHANDDTTTECSRHRRPWHLLSDEDRMQFVTGFKQLRSNGILSSFAGTHHLEGLAFEDIHKTSEFFFWHSYFVWEMESQFRALGDDYECFSMPYWDMTHDAEWLDVDPQTPTEDLPVFNSMLGGDGDPENNHCVTDELNIWSSGNYGTEFLCGDDEQAPDCCLKRERNMNPEDDAIEGLANATEIIETFEHHRFKEFQYKISLYHGKVHKFFAMSNTSHMWSNNAAEDPLFVLLHSFLDYVRMMRTDCLGYDLVSNDELEDYIPYAFDGFDDIELEFKPKLDSKMVFAYICDIEGSYCMQNVVTPRKIFDISTNTPWGVSYELGSFWSDNEEIQEMCGDKINSTWFYDESAIANWHDIVRDGIKTSMKKEYGWSMLMAMMYVIIGLLVVICFVYVLVRQFIDYKREKGDVNNNDIYDGITRKLIIHTNNNEDDVRSLYGTI